MAKEIIGENLRLGLQPALSVAPDLIDGLTQISALYNGNAKGMFLSFGGTEGFNLRVGLALGTTSVPLPVVDGSLLGEFEWYAYTGTTWEETSEIRCFIQGPVVAGAVPPTRLELRTSIAGSIVTRLRIESIGVVGIGSVAPVIVAGPNFAAIQIGSGVPANGIYLGNVANAGVNVLDYYQEGTWTPVVAFGLAQDSTGITYSQQSGFYTRIGNKVFLKIRVVLTNKGAAVGVLSIVGFPFPFFNSQNEGGQVTQYNNFAALVSVPFLRQTGTTVAPSFIMQQFGAVGSADVTNANITNTTVFSAQMVYEADP